MTDVIAPRTEGQLLLRELEDHLPRPRLLHRSEPPRRQPALGRASTTTRSVAGTPRTARAPPPAIVSPRRALAAPLPPPARPSPSPTTPASPSTQTRQPPSRAPD